MCVDLTQVAKRVEDKQNKLKALFDDKMKVKVPDFCGRRVGEN